MENPASFEIKKELRNSLLWGKYLETFGWKHLTTKNNVLIIYRRVFNLIGFIKIQRPEVVSQEDINELFVLIKKINGIFIEIEPRTKEQETLFLKNGFKKGDFPLLVSSTIILSLQIDTNQLWKNLSKIVRNSVRRSVREGFYVEMYQNPSNEILSLFSKVEAQTAKLKGFEAQKLSSLALKRDLFKNECFIFILKSKEGEVAGGNFFLGYEGSVWYLHGALVEKYRKSPAGYYILWRAIELLKDKGYKTLDLEGKSDSRFPYKTLNWKGFSDFKQRFGGKIVEYPLPLDLKLSKALQLLHKHASGPTKVSNS